MPKAISALLLAGLLAGAGLTAPAPAASAWLTGERAVAATMGPTKAQVETSAQEAPPLANLKDKAGEICPLTVEHEMYGVIAFEMATLQEREGFRPTTLLNCIYLFQMGTFVDHFAAIVVHVNTDPPAIWCGEGGLHPEGFAWGTTHDVLVSVHGIVKPEQVRQEVLEKAQAANVALPCPSPPQPPLGTCPVNRPLAVALAGTSASAEECIVKRVRGTKTFLGLIDPEPRRMDITVHETTQGDLMVMTIAERERRRKAVREFTAWYVCQTIIRPFVAAERIRSVPFDDELVAEFKELGRLDFCDRLSKKITDKFLAGLQGRNQQSADASITEKSALTGSGKAGECFVVTTRFRARGMPGSEIVVQAAGRM